MTAEQKSHCFTDEQLDIITHGRTKWMNALLLTQMASEMGMDASIQKMLKAECERLRDEEYNTMMGFVPPGERGGWFRVKNTKQDHLKPIADAILAVFSGAEISIAVSGLDSGSFGPPISITASRTGVKHV